MSKKITRKRKSKVEKQLKTAPCGYCPSTIVEEREPNKKFFMHKSKPMCGVCRAVKLSKFRKIIQKETEENGLKDMQNAIDVASEQERERLNSVAGQTKDTLKKL